MTFGLTITPQRMLQNYAPLKGWEPLGNVDGVDLWRFTEVNGQGRWIYSVSARDGTWVCHEEVNDEYYVPEPDGRYVAQYETFLRWKAAQHL